MLTAELENVLESSSPSVTGFEGLKGITATGPWLFVSGLETLKRGQKKRSVKVQSQVKSWDRKVHREKPMLGST